MSVSSSRKITQILGAELDKLVTLPLIWLTLLVTFLLNLGLAAAFTSVGLQGAAGTQNILNTELASMGYLQAGFIILGILATCSEYTGGQIRTTLTTVPWRGFQLSTKYLGLDHYNHSCGVYYYCIRCTIYLYHDERHSSSDWNRRNEKIISRCNRLSNFNHTSQCSYRCFIKTNYSCFSGTAWLLLHCQSIVERFSTQY